MCENDLAVIVEVKWGSKEKRDVGLFDGKKHLMDRVLLTEIYDAPAEKKLAKKRKVAQAGGAAREKQLASN